MKLNCEICDSVVIGDFEIDDVITCEECWDI